MSGLPPGFVIDGQQPKADAGGLPPGFVLDKPAAAPVQEDKSYTGGILPFRTDEQGNAHFDSDAGILGSIKRAVMLPGEVYSGKVDPKSDEGIERALEMAEVVSPASAAARIGERVLPGPIKAVRKKKIEPPSAEALKKAASEGYDSARDMGVDYSAKAVSDKAAQWRTELEKDGIFAELAPKSFKILDKLANPPDGSVASLAGLEAARRSFRHARKDFGNPTDQLAAKRILGGLDEFLERPDASAVVAGPAAKAGKAMSDARQNYAASKRSEQLTGLRDAAGLRADATNSGQNIDNAIRQRVASLVTTPKARAGFSKEELAKIEEIARGTPYRNAMRAIGNLFGGGGGLGSIVTGGIGGMAGASLGGLPGVVAGMALPAVGFTAKQHANSMTRKALDFTDKLARKRSPLYQQMERDAPYVAVSPTGRAIGMKAFLSAYGLDPEE